jgi:peptidyl-prolyl cis-trans isomerase D
MSDKDKLAPILEQLKAGKDFFDTAKNTAGLDKSQVEIGALTREEILIDELATVAFSSLTQGEISDPFKSPLGWHIIQVKKITPQEVKAFDEVKEMLRKDLAADKAADNLYELSNKFEDELGDGATIENAAKRLNLSIQMFNNLDYQGNIQLSSEEKKINRQIIETAFQTGLDQDSMLTEMENDGYFILRVNKITPETLRPFETVKSLVREQLISEKKREKSERKVGRWLSELRGGKSIDQLAESLNFKTKTTSDFLRSGAQLKKKIPQSLITATFRANANEFISVNTSNSNFILKVMSIKPLLVLEKDEAFRALKKSIQESLFNDITQQYSNSLKSKFRVSVLRANL